MVIWQYSLVAKMSLEPGGNRAARWTIAAIMAAVLAWGVFHAIGAYRFNQNPLRGVVVMVFSLTFLGFWLAMLSLRRDRRGVRSETPDAAADVPYRDS